MSKKLISIVTPVYNEEATLDSYYAQIAAAIAPLGDRYDFEIVLTDNASTDTTFAKVRALAAQDARIRAFRFSRNFGYQKSILTGLLKARGDAAIEFDCDLQDPPELLPQFLAAWEAGAQIVYGVRRSRQEGPFVTFLRKLFYRTINRISEDRLPPDAGDFMLLDRRVIDELRQIDDQKPYLRGTVFGLGFKQVPIAYDRRARQAGTSKFPFKKMLGLAMDGMVSQSDLPLRVASYVGILTAIVTVLLSGFYIVLRAVAPADVPPGFTTTVLLILFSISLNAIFLGIIGEYLARIYRQVRRRPLTVIQESIDGADSIAS